MFARCCITLEMVISVVAAGVEAAAVILVAVGAAVVGVLVALVARDCILV